MFGSSSVGPNLDPNCLQRLSADDKGHCKQGKNLAYNCHSNKLVITLTESLLQSILLSLSFHFHCSNIFLMQRLSFSRVIYSFTRGTDDRGNFFIYEVVVSF